jgi:hypothetical protein
VDSALYVEFGPKRTGKNLTTVRDCKLPGGLAFRERQRRGLDGQISIIDVENQASAGDLSARLRMARTLMDAG